MNPPEQETITQIAVIVRGMEKALDRYSSVFGIDRPEIHLTGPAEESQIRFRGEPTPARAKLAFIRFTPRTASMLSSTSWGEIWRGVVKSIAKTYLLKQMRSNQW